MEMSDIQDVRPRYAKSVRQWLDDAKAHKCADKNLLPADVLHTKQPSLGVQCGCGEHFILHLKALKKTITELSEEKQEALRRALNTAEGRMNLAKSMEV
jgi:hypothetical protein